jgi:hypothetical protein
MKRVHQSYVLCVAMVIGLLLGACTPTPKLTGSAVGPTVESSPVGLSATLEAPSTLPDGKAVRLAFTLTNHSAERLYVLKWYTPLEGIFGEIFRVQRDGQVIPYEGPLVMRGDPLPENYVQLDPGASVSAQVDLATSYDFTQAGDYAIEFLSPQISQVTKTEAEFVASVDDLGPVEIPCNPISLRIEESTASSLRRTLAEAAETIRGYLQAQHPQLDPDVPLSLEELPKAEAWESLRAQLFRITEGPYANESFLVRGDRVLSLGEATGGRGLTSVEISDLDGDGTAELLFTYAFGSGLHQSRIGMYAPAYGPERTYEAETGYFGDVGLVREDKGTVIVQVVESDKAASTLRYLDILGSLAIQLDGEQAELVLRLAEDLPNDVVDRVFDVTG